MNSNLEKFKLILDTLGYMNSPGLVTGLSSEIKNHKDFVTHQTYKRLNIDCIYFVNETPIIYFKYLPKASEQEITQLHKKVWNQGTTPLLFVLIGNELRIYSSYKAPVLKNNEQTSSEALLISIKNIQNLEKLEKELKDFRRVEVDTGNIWRTYARQFTNEDKINHHFLHNLKELRKDIAANKLEFKYIHNIIGRSLFILYLENRGVLTKDFFARYNSKFKCFTDLLTSKKASYEIFTDLENYFGKDIFTLDKIEQKSVTIKHLTILRHHFTNESPKDNDNYFWAYSYNLIPIELICSVYEEFLYIEEDGKEQASFTPPALAKLMLDQVLPYNKTINNPQILDPACGSSIFLVESYKRLVEKWIISNNPKVPGFNELFDILKNHIYGCDRDPEALKFTVFCLYLSMIDFIDNINLNISPNLPTIIGNNLIESDFFDTKSKLHKNKYDFIVGNPPWQSSYGNKAKDYLKLTDYPVGDKQISQLFLWLAGDLIKENGSICMLMPSKGLLYNFNPKNIEFRDKFFKTFDVKKIVNLSLFSNLLFENSKFPASIIIYGLINEENQSKSTVYYTPKPSNKNWEFSILAVDPSNVKKLPKSQIIKNHTIWKIAFVGTGRDFLLANHLEKNYPKIDYICEDREWKYGEGFQLGGGDKNINNDMAKMLNIPAKSIYPFYVNKEELEILNNNTFHRPRDFELYKAPHTLVRGGQIYAAFIDYDAVFTHAVMSFSSPKQDDSKLLKLLAAYLNSSLVLYYLFLTSSTWCIERTDIHLAEYRTLPFTLPADDKLLDRIIDTYDELSDVIAKDIKNFALNSHYIDIKDKLDNYIFDMFNLDSEQRQIIVDVNKYSINYFQDYSKSSKSKVIPVSTTKPDANELMAYAQLFCNTINKHIRKHNYKLVSQIYLGDSPLEIIAFSLVNLKEEIDEISISKNIDTHTQLRKKLDQMVLSQTNTSLYTQNNLRVYEGKTFYLVKPSEIRYWTKTMALNDSDKSLKEILRGFKS